MPHSMLQGKQTVKQSVLDMLRNAAPQAESPAMKRSCPSIIDEDFEDFAPPPPRKFSSLTATHSQKMNASSATLLNASKIVGLPPFAGAASSGSRQLDEVDYRSSATNFKCMLVFTTYMTFHPFPPQNSYASMEIVQGWKDALKRFVSPSFFNIRIPFSPFRNSLS